MKNNNPVRKGSIPMVMIVVVCLGIVAGAAIFNTGTAARVDKMSELNQAAWIIAQAAVEETIVKCSNGTAAPLDGKRQTFPAEVTFATVGLPEAKIEPVQLVARTIEDKNKTPNAQAQKEIRELSALVPGFWKKPASLAPGTLKAGLDNPPISNKGNGVEMYYDIEWRKKMLSEAPGTFDPVLLKAIKYAIVDKNNPANKVLGKDFGESNLEGEAKAYYDANVKNGGNAENDNNNNPAHPKVLDKFKALPVLAYMGPFDDEATIATKKHSAGELAQFKTAFNEATEALADHMQSRINGCNGDFNYAIGGMLTGLGRGTPCANDSEAGEESYRDTSEASGLTEYKEGLLTISTKVRLTRGSMTAEQQFSAHRIMRQMNLNTIMAGVGQSMLGYLHGYYNLTREDLIELGFMGKPDPASVGKLRDMSDDSALPSAQAGMFLVMNDRYNVFGGNTQVRNAQLANCLQAPK